MTTPAAPPSSPQKTQSVLTLFGRNLTQLAEQGRLDPVIGRDVEIRRLIEVLSRRTKNNPVLIGEPGVGKTAIAEGLALRIIHQDVPQVLWGKKIIGLDLPSLLAGSHFRGAFEARMKAIIKEVSESQGSIILFIDELHTLVGAGKTDGAMDAGQILKPELARGALRAIGATTLDEYRNFIEKDKALERRFQVVMVKEPTAELALTILRGLKDKYEVYHGVRIKDSALAAAVKLSQRYISGRFLPDKAVDLIDESASRLNIEINSVPAEIDELNRKIMHLQVEQKALAKEKDPSISDRIKAVKQELKTLTASAQKLKQQWDQEKKQISLLRNIKSEIEKRRTEMEKAERDGRLEQAAELKYGALPHLERQLKTAGARPAGPKGSAYLLNEEVGPEEVAAAVSRWTGIPVSRMLESEAHKLKNMEQALQAHVVGQEHVLKAAAGAVRRSRAGISDPRRPIGGFIFLGPTGVGKTETARALADFLFNSRDALIRVDMSEYMEKHQVSRLIGAPPGYVGHDQGGQLTEAVRRRPYSVILLDELEKAHPEVSLLLLQVLDEGRLTDSHGRTVDFKNTVLIMTSNIQIEGLDGCKSELKQQEVMRQSLQKHFRPEFLNRVDEILLFHKLKPEHLKNIVKLQIQDIQNRLREKHIQLLLDDSAVSWLAKRGFDPDYGARPLKRVIQKQLLNPLAECIISGRFHKNGAGGFSGGRVQVSASDIGLNMAVLQKDGSKKGLKKGL